jgi:O-antigen ligase
MLRGVEYVATVIAFCFLSGSIFYYPLIGITADLSVEELDGLDVKIQQVLLGTYVLVTLLLIANAKRTILAGIAVWPILLLLALAFASITWSIDPALTQRHCISLAVSTLFAVYLIGRYDLAELSRIIIATLMLLMLASLVLVVIDPAFAFHVGDDHAGSLRGAFVHKNQAGRVMILMIPAIAAAWSLGALSRPVLVFLGVFTFAFILATTSKTALVSSLPILGTIVAVNMLRGAPLRTAMVAFTLLAILWYGSVLITFNYEAILLSIGRDPSFTGRTEIWEFVGEYIAKRPLDGYGYSAFWHGDVSPGAQYTEERGVPHAHNGWLDVMLHVGLPGVIILVLTALVTLFRSIAIARYGENVAPAAFSASIILGWLTIGFSESIYMTRQDIYWIIFILAAGCARAYSSKLAASEPEGSPQPAGA